MEKQNNHSSPPLFGAPSGLLGFQPGERFFRGQPFAAFELIEGSFDLALDGLAILPNPLVFGVKALQSVVNHLFLNKLFVFGLTVALRCGAVN